MNWETKTKPPISQQPRKYKWFKDSNIGTITIRLLEENIKNNYLGIDLAINFGYDIKSTGKNAKLRTKTMYQTKSFCLAK